MNKNNIYIIDMYIKTPKSWMEAFNPEVINGPFGKYLRIKINVEDKFSVTEKLAKQHVKFRVYKSCYVRNDTYRSLYIKNTREPYRCRYCNKLLKKEYMEIDHIIPVNKVKKPGILRDLLNFKNIKDVNDLQNLCPSCHKCNTKKGQKTGIWLIRAKLGTYKWYWNIKPVLQGFLIVICIAIVAITIYFGTNTPIFHNVASGL